MRSAGKNIALRFLERLWVLFLGLTLISVSSGVFAQQDDGRLEDRLVISGADTSSAPTIVIHSYGMDSLGNPINLSPETVTIQHDGEEVADVDVVGGYQAGTFTIFVVDVPPGVSAQLPAVQQAIEHFASPPEMVERIDYISIYQIGATEAVELLAPTNFYNDIRNFFASPIEVESGPTALVDSLGQLLNDVETLKPKGNMVASIVLFTDGTDVISSQYDPAEIGGLADSLGVPIHTVWLQNDNLQAFSHTAGQDYLAQLSAQSRGLATTIDPSTDLPTIWNRIGAFRTHPSIHYRPETLTGGQHDVVLALRNQPDIRAETTIMVSAAAPSVTLDIPPESRELILENLDEPVRLSLSAAVTWLDDQDRDLDSAELLVNGVPVQEVDVRDIDRFSTEIGVFRYGPNTIQLAVTDELNQRGTSPEMILTIVEGETSVPEEIQPDSGLGAVVSRYLLSCLIILLVLGALALVAYGVRRRGLLDNLRRRLRPGKRLWEPGQKPRQTRKRSSMTTSGADGPMDSGEFQRSGMDPGSELAAATGSAYLEILDSVTRMPDTIDLTSVEHRLGRSPTQADIVFVNDITVSPLHASIVLEGSDYRIYDMTSTEGTTVNGQKVESYGRQLSDGDEIRMGETRMIYRQP